MKTYGTIILDEKRKKWMIQCAPNVAIRLKRVFGKIDTKEFGTIGISATTENSRDLEWFTLRYPMVVAPAERLRELSQAHTEKTALVDQLLAGHRPPRQFQLALPPREYQSLAADMWLTASGLLLADDVGIGKAQPLDAKVLTPTGWKLMGELRIGDEIIDPDGGTGFVEGIFPQGKKPVYILRTSDGASTRCCDEHLWLVQTGNDRQRNGFRILQLSAMRQELSRRYKNSRWSASRYFVPFPEPVVFSCNNKNLPLPPYLLGVLLGDGGLRYGAAFTSIDPEIVNRIQGFLRPGYHLRPDGITYHLTHGIDWVPNEYKAILKDLKLLGKYSYEKHIPEIYLQAPVADRIEILRGLMDTDAECQKNGHAIFSTTSAQLKLDLINLVRSLGGMIGSFDPKACVRPPAKPAYHESYTLDVRVPFNPFHLDRKAKRWKLPWMARSIKEISIAGTEETQCIRVSTKRHLYLTDDFLPTHNTVTSICGFVDPRVLPAVVVTLTHLPSQWETEINRFTPNLIVHKLKRGQPYDILKDTDGEYPDVIVTNYHKLAGWAETLAPYTNSIIFDECQELRHRGSQKYHAAKHLADACDFRLGLSATPIYNYGGEMFNVLDVLCPDRLGTNEEFIREWCTYGGQDAKPRVKDPQAFGTYLREEGLMLRRTRAEVKRELPECQTVPHHIDVDPKALESMKGQAIELAKLILKQTQDFKGQKMQASGEFDNKMRQMTGIAKAPFVAEFVKFLIGDNDEKLVLYGWHREVYKIWMEKHKKFKPVMYTGSESPVQKDAAKKAFMEGDARIMLISLRAGAGMDGLQKVCKLCVFGELDWSPGVHEQCIGRIHRDGQDEPVTAYYLLANTGADPVMSDVLGLKKAQIEGVRDPNQDLVTKLQVNEDYIKQLAKSYLQEHGVVVPEEKPVDVQ